MLDTCYGPQRHATYPMSRACEYMGPVEQNAFPGSRTANQGRHADQVDATVSKRSDNNNAQYHK